MINQSRLELHVAHELEDERRQLRARFAVAIERGIEERVAVVFCVRHGRRHRGLSGRVGCLGGLAGHLQQFLLRAASSKPVGDVALWRQPWKLQDAHGPCNAAQLRSNQGCMPAACVIVVLQENHVQASEMRREVVGPLTGTAGIAGGHQTDGQQVVDVLLALGDEDDCIADGHLQFG